MHTLLVGALIVLGTANSPALAQTLIEEWDTAKFPPPPTLKPAKIDPKETALLVLDFTNQTCTQQRRPRCATSVPNILKELMPATGEQVLPPLGPDKFINSELEKTLKDKGIKTVVAMGTQAQTSVLHTGATAALKGFNVVVPVDGMSGDNVFPELYTAWHLTTAARISGKVTLTRFDMIAF
jgi:nicotinamidase-related amidase